ncbi:hypothetical protein ACN28G_10550 [Micromonospora sp. WMMA1923]
MGLVATWSLLDSAWQVAAWVAGAALSVLQVATWFSQTRGWVCWT